MSSPLQNVIIRLNELGFFAFLPFVLTAAIVYGLLRRSKIFGEPEKNVGVNATIAIVSAFMVWAYPLLGGMEVESYQRLYSEFFFKGSIAAIFFLFCLIIISMFPLESWGIKIEGGKSGKIFGIIVLAIFVFLSFIFSSVFSGLFGVSEGSLDTELLYSIIFLIVFIGIIVAVVWLTSKEEKK